MPARHVASTLILLYDGRYISTRQPKRDTSNRTPLRSREPPDHAIVYEAKSPVRQQQHIARVRVGIIHSIEEHRTAVHADQSADGASEIWAAGAGGGGDGSSSIHVQINREAAGKRAEDECEPERGRRRERAPPPRRYAVQSDEGCGVLGSLHEAFRAATALKVLL